MVGAKRKWGMERDMRVVGQGRRIGRVGWRGLGFGMMGGWTASKGAWSE